MSGVDGYTTLFDVSESLQQQPSLAENSYVIETPAPSHAYEENDSTHHLWIVDIQKPASDHPRVPSFQMGYVGPFESYDAAEEYAETLATPFIGYVSELKPPRGCEDTSPDDGG